jgi:hypothetical protein
LFSFCIAESGHGSISSSLILTRLELQLGLSSSLLLIRLEVQFGSISSSLILIKLEVQIGSISSSLILTSLEVLAMCSSRSTTTSASRSMEA